MASKIGKLFLLLVVCFSLPAADANAQTVKRSSSRQVVRGEVGTKANELVSRYATYGLSGTVLIVKNDKIVFHKAFGLANIERKQPNALDTIYDAGSIAKTFTATAILQLGSAGKLKTSDAISKYLGEFPADKAAITIHHLLSHTSGLKLDPQDVGVNPITPRDEFFRKVKEGPLLSAPGEKYNYSNLGYGLLAIIIERVSGLHWRAYVRERILKPAGLTQTILFGETSPRMAQGYLGNTDDDLTLEEPLRLERPDSYVWRKYAIGAGGIYTTTDDLLKWWRVLHSDKVLTTAARQKMFSLQAAEQGYGWNIQKRPNEAERIYRGGLRGSFQSLLSYYPQQNVLLIYALNKNVANSFWASVLWRNLEKLIAGKPYVVPPAILTTVPADLDRYAGNYVLPSGDGFAVWREKNSLMVGAIGQSAVDLVAYPEHSAPIFYSDVAVAGKEVVAALIKRDSSKLNNTMAEKDLSALQVRWESWMNSIGGLKSYQVLGVSPGSGGNPRTFIKLNGEKSSQVVRLLFNWNQKKLIAWGDGIPMPAIVRLRPQSDTTFINFDFDTTRTLRIRFQVSREGKIEALIIPSADGKSDVRARSTIEPLQGSQPVIAATYQPTAEAPPAVRPTPRKPPSDQRFIDYVGQFDTPRGILVFTQEGETLVGEAGGSRLEFEPDPSAKDRFWAQAGSQSVTFERDASGKVVAVTVRLGGQVIKGTKKN